jgi:RNA-binding protein YhbY
MKQTVVEWLEEQIICQQNIYIDMAKKNKSLKKQVDAILTATTLLKMKCKQAKEMEKQQIIDAVDIANKKWRSSQVELILDGKQYYNETFKNK